MMNMNMMNEQALAGMLPFDTMGLYEPPKPRYIFKMPRVVPDQKEKFESDDLFRKMNRDSEVSKRDVKFLLVLFTSIWKTRLRIDSNS
jgi:hypothetical protein